MGITDTQPTNEVRVRSDALFQQVPNNVEAAEAMVDGQFVALTEPDGRFTLVSNQDEGASHLALKSGVGRFTHADITNLTGAIQEGEPVMALTGGPGVVRIPFASDVVAGQDLTVEAGYAVSWSDTGATGAFVVGKSLEDLTIPDGETVVWGDAWIHLPAKYQLSPQGSEGE